jgi:hypothetical protein
MVQGKTGRQITGHILRVHQLACQRLLFVQCVVFCHTRASQLIISENYDNFCLFCHIEGSTKKKDDFAFFIFFTFKGGSGLNHLGIRRLS